MLTNSPMIGFALTRDTARARAFYEKVLGFQFLYEDAFALVMKTEGNQIRISPAKEFTPAQHTILGWQVNEIEKLTRWLTERGVTFERYPWAKQDELGIWEAPGGAKVAWFKDPDGNVLSISQHP